MGRAAGRHSGGQFLRGTLGLAGLTLRGGRGTIPLPTQQVMALTVRQSVPMQATEIIH